MESPLENKHSGIGIASFVTSIVCLISILVLFVTAGILVQNHNGPGMYPGQMLIGFLFIFLVFFELAAIGLGIATMFQKNCNKTFGIIGLALSILTILGALGLVLLGLSIQRKAAATLPTAVTLSPPVDG